MLILRRFIPTLSVSLAALVGLAGAASALTAEEVWKAWQDAAIAGDHPLDVTSIEVIPDGIRLTGLHTSLTVGTREVGVELDLITLQRAPDDTVVVTLSEKPLLLISSGDRQARISMESQDLTAKVSGSPGRLNHEIMADRAQIKLDARRGNGAGDIPVEISLDLGRFSARSSQRDAQDAEISVAMDSLDAILAAENPVSGSEIAGKLHLESISSSASLHDFVDVDLSNLGPRVENGAAISSIITIGKTGYEIELSSGTVPEAAENLTGVFGETSFDMGLSPEGLRAKIAANGLEVSSRGFGFPPASGTLAGLDISLDMPLFPREEAVPAVLDVSLNKLAPSATMWGIFDSGAALDHSPLGMNILVSGLVKPLRSLLQLPSEEESGFPLEVSNVDLNRITVQALGATAEGTGALDFDYPSEESMFGLPLPEGVVDIKISGLVPVLEALSEAKLIQERELDAARFFMALFLEPAGDDGAFKTRIEANKEGEVLANGQRIR